MRPPASLLAVTASRPARPPAPGTAKATNSASRTRLGMSRPVFWAVVLVGIMSLLRAYAAFNFPLTPDESYYWTWSLHPSFGYTDHPPMVAWLIALGNLLGHTYGAARLPFLIAEALAALAVGMAAKLLTGETRAGAYTAIVFTLIPQTNSSSRSAFPTAGTCLRGRWRCGPRPPSRGVRRRGPRSRSERRWRQRCTRARSVGRWSSASPRGRFSRGAICYGRSHARARSRWWPTSRS